VWTGARCQESIPPDSVSDDTPVMIQLFRNVTPGDTLAQRGLRPLRLHQRPNAAAKKDRRLWRCGERFRQLAVLPACCLRQNVASLLLFRTKPGIDSTRGQLLLEEQWWSQGKSHRSPVAQHKSQATSHKSQAHAAATEVGACPLLELCRCLASSWHWSRVRRASPLRGSASSLTLPCVTCDCAGG